MGNGPAMGMPVMGAGDRRQELSRDHDDRSQKQTQDVPLHTHAAALLDFLAVRKSDAIADGRFGNEA